MKAKSLVPWLMAVLSAFLLEIPFPMAGPMPPWRAIFAWFGFVPLLLALLNLSQNASPRRGALLGYVAGVVWYTGNCYWIYDTMHIYGDLAPWIATLILLGFSLILGGYFALLGFVYCYLAARFRSKGRALLVVPALWVALDLLAYSFTSVPWDQLGYSQVDNLRLSPLAAWTGVYGITFVLMAANCVFAWTIHQWWQQRKLPLQAGKIALIWILGIAILTVSGAPRPSTDKTTATATLLQPNLDVGEKGTFAGAGWQDNLQQIRSAGPSSCRPYLRGIPETGLALVPNQPCRPGSVTLFAWPEAPSPLRDYDPRFRDSLTQLTRQIHATAVIGSIGVDPGPVDENGRPTFQLFNSASIFAPDGDYVGRYDKIHLVPFGEYTPYKDLLFFAGHLTQNVSDFNRGTARKVFNTDGHRYGVFICYEAVFAAEVREFAQLGAEVFVNISDDGWYGDTSAPWQHLNMARMRAIENHRWVLRDTNNGVTSVIDPEGRVTAAIARKQAGVLTAPFGYERVTTFYTRHGDLFAWLCAILSLLVLLRAQPLRLGGRIRLNPKSGLR